MLEGSAVSTIVLIAEIGAPRVIAWTSAAMLTCALVTLATHGLRITMCALISATHTLPLSEPARKIKRMKRMKWIHLEASIERKS